jgi:excisionase family DNA binding protein
MTEERLTYSIKEAAQKLGISKGLAYEQAKQGKLPVLKLGKRLLIPKAAFERWLEGGGQ